MELKMGVLPKLAILSLLTVTVFIFYGPVAARAASNSIPVPIVNPASDNCSVPKATFSPGDNVWMKGSNFSSNQQYEFSIASAISMDTDTCHTGVVAKGSFTSDAGGGFCANTSYTVQKNDCGVYTISILKDGATVTSTTYTVTNSITTPTPTPSSDPTPTPDSTPTPTTSPQLTSTPTPGPSATPTPGPTNTPSPGPTATPTLGLTKTVHQNATHSVVTPTKKTNTPVPAGPFHSNPILIGLLNSDTESLFKENPSLLQEYGDLFPKDTKPSLTSTQSPKQNTSLLETIISLIIHLFKKT